MILNTTSVDNAEEERTCSVKKSPLIVSFTDTIT